MISHHLPVVTIRSSPIPDLSRRQFPEFLPKLLRPEKPSSPQRGVNRRFRLALPWRINRPGLGRMPPIPPSLHHLPKLPASSRGIRATAHRHPTRQIALRSFQQQMIGVCHQNIGMNPARSPASPGVPTHGLRSSSSLTIASRRSPLAIT